MSQSINWIWNENNILGVQIGSDEHKISLFADDVVLYITKPEISLQHFHNILHTFATISGLKVNLNNLEVHPIHLQDSAQVLRDISTLQWVMQKWHLLGIWIPLDLNNIYKEHYTIVYKEIQDQHN